MKIEDQVVSFELAKEMKEQGAPQDSLFTWCEWGEINYDYLDPLTEREIRYMENKYGIKRICSAYTVAELGVMLVKHDVVMPYFNYNFGQDWCFDLYDQEQTKMIRYYADTEADARAKMWLHFEKKRERGENENTNSV